MSEISPNGSITYEKKRVFFMAASALSGAEMDKGIGKRESVC